MSDNPFAPPQGSVASEEVENGSGYWRDGPLLVIRKDASPLPERCVKCNAPAAARHNKMVQWTPRWVPLTILVCWPAFLIAFFVMRKTAKPDVGLCGAHGKRAKVMALMGNSIIVSALVLVFAGMFIESLLMLALGTAGIFIGIVPVVLASVLRPVEIDDEQGSYKGACLEFLDTLPVKSSRREGADDLSESDEDSTLNAQYEARLLDELER